MAFDPNDADRRRKGIELLSKKDWGLAEPYLKGYAMLLKTDKDPSVRSVAVRALGKAVATKYLPNVIKAMEDESVTVRWDAVAAFDSIVISSPFSADSITALDPLRKHAVSDESVDVRAACAKALRHFHEVPTIRTLKKCLLDEDFSVRYQAHASLVEITGLDLGYVPRNWPEDLRTIVHMREEIRKRQGELSRGTSVPKGGGVDRR